MKIKISYPQGRPFTVGGDDACADISTGFSPSAGPIGGPLPGETEDQRVERVNARILTLINALGMRAATYHFEIFDNGHLTRGIVEASSVSERQNSGVHGLARDITVRRMTADLVTALLEGLDTLPQKYAGANAEQIEAINFGLAQDICAKIVEGQRALAIRLGLPDPAPKPASS